MLEPCLTSEGIYDLIHILRIAYTYTSLEQNKHFLSMQVFISTTAEKQQINLNLLHRARAYNECGSSEYIFIFRRAGNVIM